MCVVSMVTDYYRDKWPDPQKLIPWYPPTQTFPTRGPVITWDQWNEYHELKRKAEEYDAKMGQPDCVKPDVADWEAKIEAFLKKRGLLPKDETSNA